MRVTEDQKYVKSLKQDDLSAFDVLFRKYSERLYAFTLSITKEPYIAEEMMTSALKTLKDKLRKNDIPGLLFYFIMFH